MSQPKLTIASAGNTTYPALLALLRKGYELRTEYTTDNDGGWSSLKIAEKEGRCFVGDSWLETLGLAALWETRGDEWQIRPGEQPQLDEVDSKDKFFDLEGNQVDF